MNLCFREAVFLRFFPQFLCRQMYHPVLNNNLGLDDILLYIS